MLQQIHSKIHVYLCNTIFVSADIHIERIVRKGNSVKNKLLAVEIYIRVVIESSSSSSAVQGAKP